MSATSHRRGTKEIVEAIQDLVEAVCLTGSVEKAFGRVEVFDSEELEEAFRHLLLSEQRVAVIVPLDEEFESAVNRGKLMVTRSLPVAILVSDQALGDRKSALWGNGSDVIGASGLAELVLAAVTGLLLEHPHGVSCEPKRVSVLNVTEMEKGLAGRVCVAVEVECRGGYLEAVMGAAPIF